MKNLVVILVLGCACGLAVPRLAVGGWTPPVSMGSGINTGDTEMSPFRDGNRLYLSSRRSGGAGGNDIWYTDWDGTSWGPVQNLTSLNTVYNERFPFVDHSGSQPLMFLSYDNHPDNLGTGSDIYVSTWDGSGWSAPVNVGSPINESSYNETAATLSADGNTIFFTSDRPIPPNPLGNENLWMATWNGSSWNSPTPITDLNTQFRERHASLLPDGSVMYFSSLRPFGTGSFDLYQTTFDGSSWSEPEELTLLNTTAWEISPCVTSDSS